MMKERLNGIKRRFAAGEDVTEELLRLAEDLMDLNEDLVVRAYGGGLGRPAAALVD